MIKQFISSSSTSWHTQEFTKGSYTAIAVGSSQIDIECLAQPLYLDERDAKVSSQELDRIKGGINKTNKIMNKIDFSIAFDKCNVY